MKEPASAITLTKRLCILLALCIPLTAFLFGMTIGQKWERKQTAAYYAIHPPVFPTTISSPYPEVTSTPLVDSTALPNPLLPKVSFQNTPGWTLKQKLLNDADRVGFKKVVEGSDQSSCDHGCKGFQFSKNQAKLELKFGVAWHTPYGTLCNNTAEYKKLSNNWYRVKVGSEYLYVQTVAFDYHTIDDKGQSLVIRPSSTSQIPEGWTEMQSVRADYQGVSGPTYAFCFSEGAGLQEQPAVLTDGGFQLSSPVLYGNPTATEIDEADAIVSSITGIKPF